MTWSEMFPQGRTIFYEGPHPRQFDREIAAHFGFYPSADPNWGVDFPDEGFTSYQFHCPAECLDEIYASGRWRMGS